MTEAGSRVIIDSLLSEVGWILRDSDGNRNVDFEVTNEVGRIDYLLRDWFGIRQIQNQRVSKPDGIPVMSSYCSSQRLRIIILTLIRFEFPTKTNQNSQDHPDTTI